MKLLSYTKEVKTQAKLWMYFDQMVHLATAYPHLDERSLVFDVGGYKGQWAIDLYSRYGSTVYIFEPVPESYEIIKTRTFRNKKIKVFNFGLYDKNIQKNITNNKESSTIFFNSDGGGNVTTIEMVDVVDFMDKNLTRPVDLVKINVEGCEYQIMNRLIKSEYEKHFDAFLIQFHRISGMLHGKFRKRTVRHLRDEYHNNFSFPYIWESWVKNSIKDYVTIDRQLSLVRGLENG